MTSEDHDYYYRYKDVVIHNGYADDLYFTNPSVRIELIKFRIIKKTPKGAYILTNEYPKPERLILDHWDKKYAHSTIAEARLAFIKRKRNQITIVETQLRNAKEAYFTACKDFGSVPELEKTVSAEKVYGMQAIRNTTPEEELEI